MVLLVFYRVIFRLRWIVNYEEILSENGFRFDAEPVEYTLLSVVSSYNNKSIIIVHIRSIIENNIILQTDMCVA